MKEKEVGHAHFYRRFIYSLARPGQGVLFVSAFLEDADCVGGDALKISRKAHFLLSCGLNVKAALVDARVLCNGLSHFLNIGSHLRLLGNDGGVEIFYLKAVLGKLFS